MPIRAYAARSRPGTDVIRIRACPPRLARYWNRHLSLRNLPYRYSPYTERLGL